MILFSNLFEFRFWVEFLIGQISLSDNSTICSNVCLGVHQRKHQTLRYWSFVIRIHQWPIDSPHKVPVTRIMFPSDEVIVIHDVTCKKCVVLERKETLWIKCCIRKLAACSRKDGCMYTKNAVMVWIPFTTTGPLWRESTGHWQIALSQNQKCGAWCCVWCCKSCWTNSEVAGDFGCFDISWRTSNDWFHKDSNMCGVLKYKHALIRNFWFKIYKTGEKLLEVSSVVKAGPVSVCGVLNYRYNI